MRRNTLPERYECESAQHSYVVRRRRAKPKGKRTVKLLEKITECLLATWPPEQIANTVTAGIVSYKTIYRWLYSGFLSTATTHNLRHKGKRRKSEKRGKFSMGVPISERPTEVTKRETFGHWELDSMVSSRGKSKGCFATFVERKSRLYTAIKIQDRKASSMQKAITQLYNTLPMGAFQNWHD